MGTYTLEKKEFFDFTVLIPDPDKKITTQLVFHAIMGDFSEKKYGVTHCGRSGGNIEASGRWPSDEENALRVKLQELSDKT